MNAEGVKKMPGGAARIGLAFCFGVCFGLSAVAVTCREDCWSIEDGDGAYVADGAELDLSDGRMSVTPHADRWFYPQYALAEGESLEGSGVELFFGTMERPNPNMLNAVLERPAYAKYVTGAGFQWAGKDALPRVRARYPKLTYVMSEQECGDGKNDWRHALHCWDLMLHYLSNGVSVYDYWNLALKKDGLSHWGWRQNSLVVVDEATRVFSFTPEYYMLKHLSHYVRRGAKRLLTDGSYAETLAFVNPDGSVIVMMANKEPMPKAISIFLDGKTRTVTLPASSVATVGL